MSPLLYAAKIGRSRVVEKLIDLGANKNKQDNRGYTVLCFKSFLSANKHYVCLLTTEETILYKSGDILGKLPVEFLT